MAQVELNRGGGACPARPPGERHYRNMYFEAGPYTPFVLQLNLSHFIQSRFALCPGDQPNYHPSSYLEDAEVEPAR